MGLQRAAALLFCLLCVGLVGAQQIKTRDYKSQAEADAGAQRLSKANRRTLFAQWKAEYKKTYATTAAEAAAFEQFNRTVSSMISHNRNKSSKFWRGLNEFSDLTFTQFAARRLMKGITPDAAIARGKAFAKRVAPAPNAARKLQQTVPLAWDWRAQGKVPPIRNQGGCGCCWAFAAIGALESKALIDGVTFSGDLSEQQQVDCVNTATGYSSMGCIGGYSSDVLRYVSGFRATTEADYGYVQYVGSCREPNVTTHPATPGSLTVAGYATIRQNREAIAAAIYNNGPVVTYFNVIASFYSYTGGVYPAAGCPTDNINHAMLIVGYNFSAPVPYFIVRNSWGNWGTEGGYIWVEATDDAYGACRMYTGLFQPLTTAAVDPDPTPSPSPSPRLNPKPCRGKGNKPC